MGHFFGFYFLSILPQSIIFQLINPCVCLYIFSFGPSPFPTQSFLSMRKIIHLTFYRTTHHIMMVIYLLALQSIITSIHSTFKNAALLSGAVIKLYCQVNSNYAIPFFPPLFISIILLFRISETSFFLFQLKMFKKMLFLQIN